MRKNLDPATIKSAAKGDERAFSVLYEHYKPLVFSICLRIGKSPDLAEDLTQEIFVTVFKKLKTFAFDSQLSTWLYRIAVNQVLMYFRSNKKRLQFLTVDELTPNLIPFYQLSLDERILLDDALGQLAPGYGTIFELKEIFGYDHREIGNLLGISEGTSKSQAHKAKQRLQKLVNRKANPKLVTTL